MVQRRKAGGGRAHGFFAFADAALLCISRTSLNSRDDRLQRASQLRSHLNLNHLIAGHFSQPRRRKYHMGTTALAIISPSA